MRLSWNNYIDAESSITAYDVNINYPESNLSDPRTSRVYRSNTVNSTEIIRFTETINAKYVCLVNHNVSSSATVYIEGSSSFATWASTATFSTTIPWSSYIMNTYFISSSYPYWQVRIVNNSTSLIYTQIGVVQIGDWLQLPRMKPDQQINDEVTSKISISDGGQSYGDDGYYYRSPTINLPYLTSTERNDIRTMFYSVKNYKPVLLDIWESSNSSEEFPMYCIIDQTNIEWKKTDDINYRWSCSLKFREVF